MKQVKKWLFPVLTLLIVAGAAALPPYISKARDAGQFGQLHAEVLEADALPVREPPTLLERLELYARWRTPSETIPSFQSPVVDGTLPETALREALLCLAEAEIIPNELAERIFDYTNMDNVLLWDPTDSMSGQEPVPIWCISGGLNPGQGSVSIDLDAGSGLPLQLSLYDPYMAEWLSYKDPDALPELGRRYFDLLGLEAELLELDDDVGKTPWERRFSVQGMGQSYRISFNATMLDISLDSNTEKIMVSVDTDRSVYSDG